MFSKMAGWFACQPRYLSSVLEISFSICLIVERKLAMMFQPLLLSYPASKKQK